MSPTPQDAMKSETRPLSAMKKAGQPAKPKRRVRFDLSSLKSTLEGVSKRSEMVLASRLIIRGTRLRNSAECRPRNYAPALVMNENRRISPGTLGHTNVHIVSNEDGTYRVMEGPDFIFTQRIKPYRDDKRTTSGTRPVQPQPSTKAAPSRFLSNLVKREQSDVLRENIYKKLGASRMDVRSIPVPADLLRWRLEQLFVEQQIKKLVISPGH